MLNLDATDNLEGLASVTNVVEFTFSGVDGTTLVSSEGKLADSQTTIRTATGILRVYSLTLVNTHSAIVIVTISKDPANAGTLYKLFSISLGVGFSAYFDGSKFSVFDASGNLVTSSAALTSDTAYAASWDGVTTIAPSKNAVYDQMELKAPKATPTFTGQATIPTINLTGGQIAFPATAVPSADPNTLDDYEEGTWTFDLQFGGAKVGITYNASFVMGSYVKIGKQVTCTGLMILSSKGSSNGDAGLGGLPFTLANAYTDACSVSLALNTVSFANQYQGHIDPGSTVITLTEIIEAGTLTNLTDANFANTSYVWVDVTYFI